MKLYAQQGSQTGSKDSNKILLGLREGYIDGAILSPKDYSLLRIQELLSEMAETYPNADRFFDPQFYATMVAHESEGRLGKLLSEDYPYFNPRRRGQLESESRVRSDIRACLEFQSELPVSAAIAPNIVIRRRLDSAEGVISRNFIRYCREEWDDLEAERPLFATLAIDVEALQDLAELEEFIEAITVLESPPDGFYLLVNNPTSEISPELIDSRTLAGWMFLNHSLTINDYRVINGFSDVVTPFLCAAGGEAGATGWFNTQKVFSMDRFAPPSGGGRRPVLRYLSKGLLNSIRFDELQRLRFRFPGVINNLPTDEFYSEDTSSEPDNQREEILQTWNAISDFGNTTDDLSLEDCQAWISTAEELYQGINLTPGMRLTGRSNSAHLEAIDAGLRLFADLAEIDL